MTILCIYILIFCTHNGNKNHHVTHLALFNWGWGRGWGVIATNVGIEGVSGLFLECEHA